MFYSKNEDHRFERFEHEVDNYKIFEDALLNVGELKKIVEKDVQFYLENLLYSQLKKVRKTLSEQLLHSGLANYNRINHIKDKLSILSEKMEIVREDICNLYDDIDCIKKRLRTRKIIIVPDVNDIGVRLYNKKVRFNIDEENNE